MCGEGMYELGNQLIARKVEKTTQCKHHLAVQIVGLLTTYLANNMRFFCAPASTRGFIEISNDILSFLE